MCDLLAQSSRNKNLSEAWVVDKDDPNLSYIHFDALRKQDTRIYLNFLREHRKRRERLKDFIDRGWSAKLHVTPALLDSRDFLEYCIQHPNINVWLTHRRNLSDQFLSFVNAGYRQSALKGLRDEGGGFVFTNKTTFPEYDVINWGRADMLGALMNLTPQIVMWRNIYDVYGKYIKVVNYEDHIKPTNLSEFGISSKEVEIYNTRDKHFIPTPKNVTKFKEQNVWNECQEILKHYQHLVEI